MSRFSSRNSFLSIDLVQRAFGYMSANFGCEAMSFDPCEGHDDLNCPVDGTSKVHASSMSCQPARREINIPSREIIAY